MKSTSSKRSSRSSADAPKGHRRRCGEHFREILLQRYEAYRRGGTNAIAPYAREEKQDSKPSLELRQAANAKRHPVRVICQPLAQGWLDYPKALPPRASEVFPWVEKTWKAGRGHPQTPH